MQTPKAPVMSLGIRRRGIEVSRAPAAAGLALSGLRGSISSSAAASFDYYISPTGSDSNPGTLASPWAITALNTKRALYSPAGIGKSIGFMDGTYNCRSLMLAAAAASGGGAGDGYYPALNINGGTAGNPVVLKAINARAAIFDASDGGITTAVAGPLIGHTDAMAYRGYVTIDGIKFQNWPTKCIDWGVYGSASAGQTGAASDVLTGTRYPGLTIQNCEFTGQGANSIGGFTSSAGYNLSAIQMYGATGARIYNNYIHDNVGYTASNGDHLVAIMQWWSDDSVIENNTVINAGNIYGKEVANQRAIIRYNYVYNPWTTSPAPCIADFTCMQTAGTGRASIHNNVLIGAQGVDYTQTLYSAISHTAADIYNNTIYVLSFGANIAIREWATGCNVYNNIIAGTNSGDPGTFSFSQNALALSDYNGFTNSSASLVTSWFTVSGSVMSRTGLSGLSAYQSYQSTNNGGLSVESHSVFSATPTFTTGGAPSSTTRPADFALQSGSPLKSAGRVGGTSGGAVIDMGANTTTCGCNFA